ncbi:hypothetical protein MC885_017654, partial [Smutsia gigantea]
MQRPRPLSHWPCPLASSRRLCGQLLGDPSGVTEMQQPLALPGDREAPRRLRHRWAQKTWCQGALEHSPSTSAPQAGPPHPTGPPHTLRCPSRAAGTAAWLGLPSLCSLLLPPAGPCPGGCRQLSLVGWAFCGAARTQWALSRRGSEGSVRIPLGYS